MKVVVPMHDFVQPEPDDTDPHWHVLEADYCGRCGGHKRDHPLEITEN